jgi:hypothetical protein
MDLEQRDDRRGVHTVNGDFVAKPDQHRKSPSISWKTVLLKRQKRDHGSLELSKRTAHAFPGGRGDVTVERHVLTLLNVP